MANLSRTENNAVAYASCGSKNLDLMISSVRGADESFIREMVAEAWTEDPLTLVKLIAFTRNCRDGKGERCVSYYMLKWLKENAKETYKKNIKLISTKYGRIDDLLKMTNKWDDVFPFELEVFAELLKNDLELEHPSLAVKWAPRENKKWNDLVPRLADICFPGKKNSRELYRKNILRPLSEKVKILETYMANGKWNEIEYEQVPAQAMRIYGKKLVKKITGKNKNEENVAGAFYRNDSERFSEYLRAVKAGKAKINTTGIQPHQLVGVAMNNHDDMVEQQWEDLISKLRGISTLEKCMSVVDVSGSMSGQPVEVAISLGLVIATLAKGRFNNKMITFSSDPKVINIVGNNLHEKVTNMSRADWEMTTDLEKVFDLILNMAVMFDIPKENMIESLFIFTDMQFNEATGSEDITLFETIKKKYTVKGYQLPKLVFWNLRQSDKKAFPVLKDESGCVYLSGFSTEFLKVFLLGIEFTPMNVLNVLLERYNDIVL